MEYRDTLPPGVTHMLVMSLDRAGTSIRSADFGTDIDWPATAVEVDMGGEMAMMQTTSVAAFQSAVVAMVDEAREALLAGKVDIAGDRLFQSAMAIETQLVEIDIVAVEQFGRTVSDSFVAPSQGEGRAGDAAASASAGAGTGGSGGGGPPSPGLPDSIRKIFLKLKQLGQWLLSIIQNLLTPKGWSMEGEVGIPLLTSAKITVDFGQ